MRLVRGIAIWVGLVVAVSLPIYAASRSPLLEWREPVYIAAGYAGVIALTLLLLQPLLAEGAVPGLAGRLGRRVHRWIGAALLAAVAVHVIGLWITSPPDVIDALLFVSPTPFSAWGVIAMWALFATALLATFRRRLRVRWRVWRVGHTGLAVVIVGGTVVHAVLIDGTMETFSKVALCGLVVVATLWAVLGTRLRGPTARQR